MSLPLSSLKKKSTQSIAFEALYHEQVNQSTLTDNLAVLRPDSSVSVDVVLQSRDCLEHARADVTLVRSLFRMSLHVPSQ